MNIQNILSMRSEYLNNLIYIMSTQNCALCFANELRFLFKYNNVAHTIIKLFNTTQDLNDIYVILCI